MELNPENIEEKSEEELKEESKKSTKYFILITAGLLILFLAILAGTKYLGIKGYKSVEYNGFEFINVKDAWHFQWQDQNNLYNIALRFNPIQAQEAQILGELNKSFNTKEKIYVTFDPTLQTEEMKYVVLGTYELLQTLMGPLQIKATMACTKNETDTCKETPIIDCNNKNESVIYLNYGEPTQIELKDNCIILQGKELELLRSVDGLLYQWLRVI